MYYKAIAILAVLLCILTACSTPSEQTEMEKFMKQVEDALPEEYVKQSQTEVYDIVYRDEEDNEMIYYICRTTFYAADPDDVTGVHIEAISAVFNVEIAELLQELEATGHPAAIYELNGRHFMCCTITPETSVVLDYDPESVSDQEAVLTIRSIFEGPDVAKELEP